MIKLPDQYRVPKSLKSEQGGVFTVPIPNNKRESLCVIASTGNDPIAEGWEHVSVSVLNSERCPYWWEMCIIKDLFWEPDDCVIQFHPPKSQYINVHASVLHLWRQRDTEFTLPPRCLV